ncbi:ribosome-recycling factor [Blattabacterium cuenoti]|uniref:ribosome-recycling factor n=1 Tax=Blattabacterium cuenoti TaxID=1653831 RepID=UPI00163CDC65|nr:ribosome recycling factor [Blattabacterium cuenoti]
MDNLNNIFYSCKKDMETIFIQLKEKIHPIRLGSKSVAYSLSKIKIKCYKAFFPLEEVSNITIVDNMNLIIRPWDPSILSHIDKAIIDANLGFFPTNKGESIHIRLPIMTEEGRKNLMKKIKLQTEHAKILVRNVRKKNNQFIRKLKISEDFYKTVENRIQKITSEYIKKIEDYLLDKEKEIIKI